MRRGKTLGEDVSYLITSGNVTDLEITMKNSFMNKVVIYFNSFDLAWKTGLETMAMAETLSH